MRYVDTGSAARAAAACPGCGAASLHLFHITRLWRAMVLAPLFAVLPGRTVLVLHSGSTDRQLAAQRRPGGRAAPARACARTTRSGPSTGRSGDVLPPGLRRRVTVVRFPVGTARRAGPGRRDATRTPSASPPTPGQWHYHADLAVEAVRLVREEWPDARLRILAYGHDGADLARLRELVAGLDWVELSFDASPGGGRRRCSPARGCSCGRRAGTATR